MNGKLQRYCPVLFCQRTHSLLSVLGWLSMAQAPVVFLSKEKSVIYLLLGSQLVVWWLKELHKAYEFLRLKYKVLTFFWMTPVSNRWTQIGIILLLKVAWNLQVPSMNSSLERSELIPWLSLLPSLAFLLRLGCYFCLTSQFPPSL